MKTLAIALLLLVTSAAPHEAAPTPGGGDAGFRFLTVPIHLDPHGQPLAAYQLDLRDTTGRARIVGIEGGEHPAFAVPPHHDPRAIQHDRIILAAFSTLPAAQLPTARTRVATLHVATTAARSPEWSLQLSAAAGPAGEPVAADARVGEEPTP